MRTEKTIKNCKGEILYQDLAASWAELLESAIKDGIDLKYGDFRGLCLVGANLDGADFGYADFSGANLTGANMAECNLSYSQFGKSCLVDACLAESHCNHTDFADARLGATLIAGGRFYHCRFENQSAFTLDFVYLSALSECVFVMPDGRRAVFSHPPVVIGGLEHKIIFLDHEVIIGGALMCLGADVQERFFTLFRETMKQQTFVKKTA